MKAHDHIILPLEEIDILASGSVSKWFWNGLYLLSIVFLR
ncbi:hypothetical protein CYOC110262_23715 [Cytobacillus oceanisediminis]|uniref:Uncharacterized protein n=1 Tax=Cytobacillus oceanisediminis TaxID=665099 RepID=A0A562K6T2_9BACI|nr:hypothetical protein IQ19_00413 [Cytobacillus oceanisediminis]